ncbi:NUDIX hydrolase [Gluconacetobacter sacchari]|uniref:Uncharacterized protein n=2 Tax=Gluconacetobacter sacchari TaxID=92759 RepID=A0A7W4IEU3_9PROT|nr:hypothetical protein [Gluconacetobacter sacchari]MBB2161570.1 hypothetical protein [Gluconacetobacter sacchari]
MVENFDRCAEAWADKKVRWARMAAAFAEDGLTNLDGGAAQPETLKKTWYRVRAKVAEGRVRLAEEAERKARERLRRKHERDILDAARHAAAPDLRPDWQSRPAYQVMPGADGFTIPSEPADRIAPTPAQAAPAVAPSYAAPPPATRHQEPVAVEPLAEGDPLLLSPLASQEELDRSDQDWPYQKPRAQWGEIRVLTVETLEAQPESARKWRYGPDLPPERGFERLPLKMTFESEDDWLRCWYYLFKKRQREAPLPQTYAEVIIGIAAGRVALELPMEVCLKRQALGRANRAATRGIFS